MTRFDLVHQRPGEMASAKVRWDEVRDDLSFWADKSAPAMPPIDKPTEVRIWLFGSLFANEERRPIELRMARGATVAGVLAELGRILGAERIAEVVTDCGEKRRTCRLFVDSKEVDDLSTPVAGDGAGSDMELIVLAGIEGG